MPAANGSGLFARRFRAAPVDELRSAMSLRSIQPVLPPTPTRPPLTLSPHLPPCRQPLPPAPVQVAPALRGSAWGVRRIHLSPVKRIFPTRLLTTVSTFAGDSIAPDFSKYPRSEGFDYFVQAHRAGDFFERQISDRRQKADSRTSSFEPLILAISHFWRDSGSSAIEYFVTISGYATNCREIYNWATQDSHNSQLTPDQLARLKDAITKLPKTNSYPPLGQLVIVSFRSGDTWVTRTCRPEDVQSIYAVLGERFETVSKETSSP